MQNVIFIIYVADQGKSRDFYAKMLDIEPQLDVPGMTEFPIAGGAALGIMTEAGISRILGGKTKNPAKGSGIPRCEIYLRFHGAEVYFKRFCEAGGKVISEFERRSWGERVAYGEDPDGHIVAIAEMENGL